jgi:hypothetical protein
MTRTIRGMKITGRFTVACTACGRNTTPQYARQHNGACKSCVTGEHITKLKADCSLPASREEQNARYIDCGPAAWDDR